MRRATNDQFLKDVANGRTDVILNDYYLQKLALAAMPDLDLTIHPDLKYVFKIGMNSQIQIRHCGEREFLKVVVV